MTYKRRETNEFNPDWDAMAVLVEEQQRMAIELRRLHEMNAELVEALRVVIRGVPDTWDGVKQAKAVLAKAQGEKND